MIMDGDDIADDFMGFFGPAMWYFGNHCGKAPCHDGSLTGQQWLDEVLAGNPRRCRDVFRMFPSTFTKLLDHLIQTGLLSPSAHVSAEEKLGTFLYIVGHSVSNRLTQERFQRCGWTVTKWNYFFKLKQSITML